MCLCLCLCLCLCSSSCSCSCSCSCLFCVCVTPARRHAGTQAHRHAGTPARRQAGPPAHRPAGKEEFVNTDIMQKMHFWMSRLLLFHVFVMMSDTFQNASDDMRVCFALRTWGKTATDDITIEILFYFIHVPIIISICYVLRTGPVKHGSQMRAPHVIA